MLAKTNETTTLCRVWDTVEADRNYNILLGLAFRAATTGMAVVII